MSPSEKVDGYDVGGGADTNPVSKRTPITVLSGALGSGKTTLLKYILEKPHGFKVAVIQNEFSEEMGIESPLITDEKGETFKDIVELPNGCLCCSAKDGLLVALDALLEDKRRFDYVLVEATGVADPEAICEIFWVDDGLGCRVYLDGVVTVVDAHNALSALGVRDTDAPKLEHGDAAALGLEAETAKQVACADVLILNKCDLAGEAERKRIAAQLTSMNPVAKLFESTNSSVPLDAILGIHAFDRSRVATLLSDLSENTEAGHGHGHEDSHGHGHSVGHGDGHGHDAGYAHGSHSSSAHHGHGNAHAASAGHGSVRPGVMAHRGVEGILLKGVDSPSAQYDPDKVQSWMAEVLWESKAGGVYRCKGLFLGPRQDDDTDDEDEPMDAEANSVAYALQGVGKLFEIEEAPQVKEVPVSKFLFIGKDIKRDVLEAGLEKCLIKS